MKIKKIIGFGFVIFPVVLLGTFYASKNRVQKEFDVAFQEIIHTASGEDLGSLEEFRTHYRHSHGILVRNGKEEEGLGDITITTEHEVREIRYERGHEEIFRSFDFKPVTVRVNHPFDGDIDFLHYVCGCETMGPSLLFYGSLLIAVVLCPIGLYLTTDKTSNKSGEGTA